MRSMTGGEKSLPIPPGRLPERRANRAGRPARRLGSAAPQIPAARSSNPGLWAMSRTQSTAVSMRRKRFSRAAASAPKKPLSIRRSTSSLVPAKLRKDNGKDTENRLLSGAKHLFEFHPCERAAPSSPASRGRPIPYRGGRTSGFCPWRSWGADQTPRAWVP